MTLICVFNVPFRAAVSLLRHELAIYGIFFVGFLLATTLLAGPLVSVMCPALGTRQDGNNTTVHLVK